MLQVRYPDGRVLVYNDANFLSHGNDGFHLYTRENGKWVASIQGGAGVIVETVSPCRITRDLGALFEGITDKPGMLRLVPGRILAVLKGELERFNRQTWRWKD